MLSQLDLAERLTGHGYVAVPHLAARMVRDKAELAEIVDRLAGKGITRVFVPGGDADPPGAYPDALFLVAREELSAFVSAAAAMHDQADYLKLRERFGVLRTSRAFWSHSDRMHEAARALDPLRAGLFDFNRLDPG